MSGGGSQTSTTTQQLSPEQQRILGLVTPVFESYFPKATPGGTSAEVFPGQTLAGKNPIETIGQQMTLGAVPGIQGNVNASLQGSNFLASGDVLDVMRNPALAGAVDAAVRPITQSFGEQVLPNIRGEAVAAGGYGGNRQGIAEGIASRDYLRQVGDTSSALINQAYQGGLDAMAKGVVSAPLVQQGALLPGAVTAGVGAQERAFGQASIDDMVQRFYLEQFLPLMLAQQVAGTAFGIPGGSTVTVGSGGGTSPLQGGLGGAASGAMAGTMVMPGWGTAVGGLLGGLLGAFGS